MSALRVVILWSVAVVFPLPLMLVYDALATEPVNLKQLVLFGLIAYCWWLLAILLSIRPRWLDRFVGMPAVYRLHGVLGIGALVLAYIHDQNSYTSNRLAETLGDWGLYGAIFTLCLAVFFLSGWLVDRSRPLLMARRCGVSPSINSVRRGTGRGNRSRWPVMPPLAGGHRRRILMQTEEAWRSAGARLERCRANSTSQAPSQTVFG